MIPLIQLNMLPYREEQDKQKKAQFTRLMVFSGLIGVGLLVFTYVSLSGLILNQESRNRQLTAGIEQLDIQIKEVETLEAEKRDFLARKAKVEELENKRFEAARMIDSLNTVAPEGIYLTGIKAKDVSTYTLSGKATSDSKIADLMRVIPSTNVFGQPSLDRINKVESVQEFELTVAVSASAPMNGDYANVAPVVMSSEAASVASDVSASIPNTPVAPASSATATSSPAN
ncbi:MULTISPECIES: PilN domain-containing protein [Eikenella]|uniref:Pilus assembly protein PilP n=1 Tax=Eikenella exigua TaxID=2528037 RepID=A0AAX1F812_9NEIS|nr:MULTISPECIES: PilN domain-containing protein [Eikenella]OAM28571.1 pilus assembly protein PilP [Eikenella sp. NML01-A-086]OAM41298.1 pilus assembly protein PilP [Eikenella sp. NML97-A-109]QED92207.1 pilus assembly protein PilP [Eikenella exigua]